MQFSIVIDQSIRKQHSISFLLPCIIIFLFFLYKLKCTKKNTLLPPSPPKLPIIGNLHQLGSYPHHSLKSISDKYGKMMLLQLGSIPTLIISSPDAARKIMKTNDAIFTNRATTRVSMRLLNNGKDIGSVPYGEYWRQMRSVCVLHLLNNKSVTSFRVVREEETFLLMENIKIQGIQSVPVNLSQMFTSYAVQVVCRVAFGRKYDDKETDTNFRRLMKDFMVNLGRIGVGDCIPWLAWIDRLTGTDAKVEKIANEFDRFIENVLVEHADRRLVQRRRGKHSHHDEKVKDFVDVLLEVQEGKIDDFSLDKDSIKGLILDMLAAGSDTSVSVLEWTMSELLKHPKVLEEVQEEVRRVKGDEVNVDEDDLEQLKYMKAVIKETLRLHPPVGLIPRKSTQDVKIDGCDLPAGTSVLINSWAIHRDPSSWDEPEKFNPKRFLNSAIGFTGQDFELIPFGSGRRICPGISYAMANIELVLANLVHKFDWKLPGDGAAEHLDMSERIGLTSRRKAPLLAVALARE